MINKSTHCDEVDVSKNGFSDLFQSLLNNMQLIQYETKETIRLFLPQFKAIKFIDDSHSC